MSIVESGRELGPDAPVTVVDTTEVRWFFSGPAPADVREWFIASSGVAEERTDTYRLDGRADVGVKRRYGETLELKVRQDVTGSIGLRDGLVGQLEKWRKWSPAGDLVEHVGDARWGDVHKFVVKRRFSVDGTEIDFSREPELTGAGCDVEIAGVTVGRAHWWSFAFAAFGPETTRRDALIASWNALATTAPGPEQLECAVLAMGYPEWLSTSPAGGEGGDSRFGRSRAGRVGEVVSAARVDDRP